MKNLKGIIKYTLSLGLGIGLMWWVYHKQDMSGMLQQLKETHFFWVGLCFIAAIFSHISRAIRWNMLLKPLGHEPSLFLTFYAVMMGYLANLVFPRAGEVSRCAIISKSKNIPIENVIGTVVAERIIDLLSLLAIVFVTIIIEFEKLSGFITKIMASKDESTNNHSLLFVILTFFIVLTIVIVVFRKKIKSNSIVQKIIKFGLGFAQGVVSVKDVENKWSFIFHTIVIWLMYYCTVYFLFFAFDTTSHLGVNVALALFVIGSMGMVAPVPGGVGAFHFLVTQGLILYGLSENIAAEFAALAHAIQMFQIIIIGGVSFFAGIYIFNKK